MRVRFWGTRGSIAAPGPDTLRYGGNTPCVEVRADDGTLLIFDCGTGARELGLRLAASGPVRAHLFIGHTHADHIQGLPFFVPAFLAGSNLTIYGPAGIDRSLPTAIGGQMDYAYFPVPINALPAQLDFQELGESEFSVGDIRVRTQYLNHTAPCLGYRVEVGGVAFVYATDHEPYAATIWRPDRPKDCFDVDALLHPGDARHAEFLRGADLVIHDAQYTDAEYGAKAGWGHSTVEYTVDIALAARARRLVLFHHDPTRTDEALDAILAEARARVAATAVDLEIVAAAEGAELTLLERPGKGTAEQGPHAPLIPTRARILVVDDDDDLAGVLEEALVEDGYEVVRVADGADAVAMAVQHRFDLILLDGQLPTMDGFDVCRVLRADEQLATVPIVMLTARTGARDLVAAFGEGITDYMTKPFAVAQLRARVRAWLTRSADAGT